MNKIKKFLKIIPLLIGATVGAIVIPIILFYGILLFELYIGFWRPDLTYKGDKTVPEEDVIYYGKITLRDLRLDKVYTYDYDNRKECHKYFVVKKNHLSFEKLHERLSQFCRDYYKNQTECDEVNFHFYWECAKMPWYWNDEGHFPDLELNPVNKIGAYGVNKDGSMDFWVKKKGKSFYNYGKILKEIKSFSDDN
ncbi:MAG: hypothetical protein K2J68_04205 [Treponemataceae bacterium]|nr:hypothetical protein [Treponemataceae bacterium]